MALQPSIILQGQVPDVVNTLARSSNAARITNDNQRQNALAGVYQQHGPGILAGEKQSMNALAMQDPMQAMDIQNMQRDNARADQQFEMQVQQYAQGLSAQQAAAEAQAIEQGIVRGISAYEAGDLAGVNAILQQAGEQPIQSLEQFPAVAARYGKALDILKSVSEFNAPQGFRQVKGSELGLTGPQADAMFNVSPDGKVTQIGGSGSTVTVNNMMPSETGPAPEISPAAPNAGADTQFQNAGDAFGGGGVVRGAINRVSDIVAGRVPFPDTLEAQRDFAVFGEGLINAFASAYGRQPPSWLLRNIEALTPKAGNLFEGPAQAQSKLRAMSRDLRQRREALANQVSGAGAPKDRSDIMGQIAGIDATLTQLNAALEGFVEGGAGDISAEDRDYLKSLGIEVD